MSGCLNVSGTGRIDSSLVVGDTMRSQDIVVSGNARVAGDINVGGDLVFKNGTGISVATGTGSTSEIYSYGKTGIGTSPPINTCFNPNPPWQTHTFGGLFQVYDNGPSGYTGGSILSLQSWSNGSSIDVAGGGGLLVNYFCGKDIAICTGSLGGTIFAGDKFRPSKNVQIGPHWQTLDPNVALDVYLNGTTDGVKVWAQNPTDKLFHDAYDQFMVMGNGKTSIGVNATPSKVPYKTLTVNGDASFANYGHPTDGLNAFEIVGNNQTPLRRGISLDNDPNGSVNFWINSNQSPSYFKFKNSANNFDLMILDINGKLSLTTYATDAIEVKDFNAANKVKFLVKASGQTFIGDKKVQASNIHSNAILQVGGKITCQELVVLDPVKWADFVFEKNYKLTPLNEVEKYYLANKHLKDVPNAKEVKENGINSAEIDAILLQKVEELTLYTVDLNKQVQELKKENAELKSSIKNK